MIAHEDFSLQKSESIKFYLKQNKHVLNVINECIIWKQFGKHMCIIQTHITERMSGCVNETYSAMSIVKL